MIVDGVRVLKIILVMTFMTSCDVVKQACQ